MLPRALHDVYTQRQTSLKSAQCIASCHGATHCMHRAPSLRNAATDHAGPRSIWTLGPSTMGEVLQVRHYGSRDQGPSACRAATDHAEDHAHAHLVRAIPAPPLHSRFQFIPTIPAPPLPPPDTPLPSPSIPERFLASIPNENSTSTVSPATTLHATSTSPPLPPYPFSRLPPGSTHTLCLRTRQPPPASTLPRFSPSTWQHSHPLSPD